MQTARAHNILDPWEKATRFQLHDITVPQLCSLLKVQTWSGLISLVRFITSLEEFAPDSVSGSLISNKGVERLTLRIHKRAKRPFLPSNNYTEC